MSCEVAKSFVFGHSGSLMRRLEKLDLIIKKEIVTVCIALRLLRLKKMGNVKVVNTMLKYYEERQQTSSKQMRRSIYIEEIMPYLNTFVTDAF